MGFHKRSPSRLAFDTFNILLMILISFICIAPVWHVIMSSISDPIALNRATGMLFTPLGDATLEGYRLIFQGGSGVLRGYANTAFYLVAGVSFSIFLTILAGYGLSRKGLMWGNLIMFILAFTMLFSGGLIPFFLLVRALGWLDTRWAIIIPGAVSVFNIIIMRTAFAGIPDSLEESAKMDGAGQFTIMLRIMVPLAKATVAVLVLFYSIGVWNSWFNASIFLLNRDLFPLQLILREIILRNDVTAITTAAEAAELLNLYRFLVQYTTIVAATLPVLCFYPFAQKYFVQGVMIGSIKG